jgi:hypothetical protein
MIDPSDPKEVFENTAENCVDKKKKPARVRLELTTSR